MLALNSQTGPKALTEGQFGYPVLICPRGTFQMFISMHTYGIRHRVMRSFQIFSSHITPMSDGSLSVFRYRIITEPRCEKTGLRGFRPGPTQTRLYNHTCSKFRI